MITEKDIELIDQYLSDKLSIEEKGLFRKRLETDHEFALEYAFLKNVKISAGSLGRQELKKKMENIALEFESENQSTSENKGKSKTIYTFLKIAAGILLLLGISSILYFQISY